MDRELNFVLIPLLAASHMMPMLDMAKLIAERGVTVTLVMTPLNAIRFNAVIDGAVGSGLPIRVVEIQFPAKEAGLPDGCESVDVLPSLALIRNFIIAVELLQDRTEKVLGEMKPRPSCIICDKNIDWMADTAEKLEVPRIIFDGMSCFNQMCKHQLYMMKDKNEIPESGSFVIPGLPDRFEVSKAKLPGAFNPGSIDSTHNFRDKIRAAETRAYGVVINTFEELEQRYVDKFHKLKKGKVWCIGPLSLHKNDRAVTLEKEECLKWLDSRQDATVVYACLGSLSQIRVEQFVELALGIEASGYPFILVVKAGEKQGQMEKWILENGFEERTRERGLLIRGWAPQVLILSHPAVGGFLSHCGWNSSLEGISAGVPMVTWPLSSEQFLNERFLVDVLKIGAAVGSQQVVHLGEEDMSKVLVTKENVRGAIEKVMKHGEDKRKIAKQLGHQANKAVQTHGSSHLALTRLINEIQQLKISSKLHSEF